MMKRTDKERGRAAIKRDSGYGHHKSQYKNDKYKQTVDFFCQYIEFNIFHCEASVPIKKVCSNC